MHQLFSHKNLPMSWIVRDPEGAYWIVPSIPNGWASRKPARLGPGQISTLEPSNLGLGLGIPGVPK